MSMNLENIIARLKEPFPFEETECKIQSTTKDKSRGLVVFYINNRAIQNRLDEVVGPFNWKNEYVQWQDKAQICGISIYDDSRGIWVSKFDGAENTQYEPIKGGLSDAMKRAAVIWGLGRYLYDIEGFWVDVENGRIKDGEKDRLRDHYNRFIGKPAGSGNNAGQQSYGGAARQQQRNNSQDAPQNQPPPQHSGSGEYDYQVQDTKKSGNSKCLKLLSKKGAQIIAYAPLNNPLKSGARIKNANLEKRQADFGDYYLMHAYEIAA